MEDNNKTELLDKAFKASFENKGVIQKSKLCGCFHCLKVFSKTELDSEDYIKDKNGFTALCPYCGADAVLGDWTKLPLTKEFLEEMQEKYFK